MGEGVVAGLITGIAAIISQLIIAYSKNRETSAKMAAHEQKQEDALEDVKKELVDVKKKLDIHNGYAEKIGGIKVDIKAIQKDIEYLRRK